MPGKIIGMHQHLAGCEHRAEELVEECERLGIVKSVLLALPPSRVPDKLSRMFHHSHAGRREE